MMKVSAVIPVYNVEEYLQECLESISCQTLEEVEIICIDDGSVDNSYNILLEYQKSHSNVIISSQKNVGSGGARNTGISLASGEYLIFIDPDDYLAECDVLEVLYEAAKVNDVAVCGGNYIYFKTIVENGKKTIKTEKYIKESEGMTTFKEYSSALYHQRFIIKRELLTDNKIYYPEYRRGQDLPFMTNVLNAAENIYFVNKDVYMYRTGHKEVVYTEETADALIYATCDVLELAINKEARELFCHYKDVLVGYTKQLWYKLLNKNNTWYKTVRVKELISKGDKLFGLNQSIDDLMNQDTYVKFYEDIKRECDELVDAVKGNKKFVIYGAGAYGKLVGRYLIAKGYSPVCFVVSKVDENEKKLEGVPVISIDALQSPQEYLFILGANVEKKAEMKNCLQSIGCNNFIDFDCVILNYL